MERVESILVSYLFVCLHDASFPCNGLWPRGLSSVKVETSLLLTDVPLQVQTHTHPLFAIRLRVGGARQGMGDELLVVCNAEGSQRAPQGEEHSTVKI